MRTGTVELPKNSGWERVTQAYAPNPSLAGQKGLIFPLHPTSFPWHGTHSASREGGEGSSTAEPAHHERD